MEEGLRVMSERPLNAETPAEYLRSWITANAIFFARNQGVVDLPSERRRVMKDTDLDQHVLGLREPWSVSKVELDQYCPNVRKQFLITSPG